MTYAEKLAEAKRLYQTANAEQKYLLESLFPELSNLRDERIRKEIISVFKGEISYTSKETIQKYIAWLEKQGNQREQLINKACDVLVNCIEDYMLRRMEVWNEECKKQTLENIRKKLEE